MLSRRDPDCRFRKNDMVIGIMGKTQGVKMVSQPEAECHSQKGRQIAGYSGAEPAGDSGAERTAARHIPRELAPRPRSRRGVHSQGGRDVLGDGWDAMRGIAHLVAGLKARSRRAGRRILFQL